MQASFLQFKTVQLLQYYTCRSCPAVSFEWSEKYCGRAKFPEVLSAIWNRKQQATRTQSVFVCFMYFVYICIRLQKLLMYQGQAFSQGNGSVCRIFEFLTIAGMMPVGLAADGEACKLLHNGVTKTEQGTFWNSEFLKVFHVARRHYFEGDKIISSVVLIIMIHLYLLVLFSFAGKLITVNNTNKI